MKRILVTLNLGRRSIRLRQLLVTGRMFALLSICSMLVVIIVGSASIIHQRTASSPLSSMKGFAAAVSDAFFADMLGMEMPAFQSGDRTDSFSGKQIASFLIRLLTDINPGDPRSLLAGGLPALDDESATLLRGGIGADSSVGPEDNEPIVPDNGVADGDGAIGEPEQGGNAVADGQTDGEDDHGDEPAQQGEDGNNDGTAGDKPGSDGQPADSEGDGAEQNGNGGTGQSGIPTTGGRKVVFIYHSHSRESWTTVLGDGSGEPSSATKNISLVGKRLADKLEQNGIGAMHSSTDYPSVIKGFKWAYSYKYSKKTVQEAMAADQDLQFFFDIHRDSQKRKYTTTKIGGKDYAQVYFIIGHKNPNWEKNEAFATKIHNALEQKYPGLSRGIWGKTSANGNGEYNQSLAPDSVLIEIGGIDNTLEESYRTADVMAQVIADIYWENEKVSAAGGK
ncbi:stage II sporulation protein P [Paenibacillus beijingensis]|uniref:Stage II sporulation protein P n=1 Tax=Paenibacillus beijingensis TaxID=1126833 RepID=A0A0D5NLT6_9BACL|nr:stage II sporulation protein P [Paenibacillus beijingensis]AJY76289.1 stage II sporulation protein P [Paenibacillus beijingensis]